MADTSAAKVRVRVSEFEVMEAVIAVLGTELLETRRLLWTTARRLELERDAYTCEQIAASGGDGPRWGTGWNLAGDTDEARLWATDDE